jgi:uncharacterized membrane protein YqiK
VRVGELLITIIIIIFIFFFVLLLSMVLIMISVNQSETGIHVMRKDMHGHTTCSLAGGGSACSANGR